ncbi:unnamed protein product [Caenorhabditis auriculariae]|uniref:Epoxide hydrolase n=1 Tax=Caenorhabditis auriculariae TaxID=2777116 RepID=A0A8S1HLX6_9PELO|nr:unnamed protein product [Caenorhabditis auriculariae]
MRFKANRYLPKIFTAQLGSAVVRQTLGCSAVAPPFLSDETMVNHLFHAFLASAIGLLFFAFQNYVPNYPVHQVDKDGFWKTGEIYKDDDQIKPFSIDIDQKRIENFKTKLKSEIVPKALIGDVGAESNEKFLTSLRKVMLDFDWAQHQHFLNTFKQYTREIEGLKIHFARVSTPTGKNKRLVPLLILHGFPGSFWDFFKVIPILSNPSRHGFDFGLTDSIHFDVIIPSLPGFLFSEKPELVGLDPGAIVRIITKLLERLDVYKYYVHGCQGFGADLAALLASQHPSNVLGLHLSDPFVPPTFSTSTFFKYAVEGFFDAGNNTSITEYFNSRPFARERNPTALGIFAQNSPLGTAAYLMELWRQYSIRNSEDVVTQLNERFTLDELATEIYLQWLTETVPIALTVLDKAYNVDSSCSQVKVPTAVVYTPESPWRSSWEVLAHKFFNITRFTELPKGGLFHHLQDAHKIAADIFGFVEIELG